MKIYRLLSSSPQPLQDIGALMRIQVIGSKGQPQLAHTQTKGGDWMAVKRRRGHLLNILYYEMTSCHSARKYTLSMPTLAQKFALCMIGFPLLLLWLWKSRKCWLRDSILGRSEAWSWTDGRVCGSHSCVECGVLVLFTVLLYAWDMVLFPDFSHEGFLSGFNEAITLRMCYVWICCVIWTVTTLNVAHLGNGHHKNWDSMNCVGEILIYRFLLKSMIGIE